MLREGRRAPDLVEARVDEEGPEQETEERGGGAGSGASAVTTGAPRPSGGRRPARRGGPRRGWRRRSRARGACGPRRGSPRTRTRCSRRRCRSRGAAAARASAKARSKSSSGRGRAPGIRLIRQKSRGRASRKSAPRSRRVFGVSRLHELVARLHEDARAEGEAPAARGVPRESRGGARNQYQNESLPVDSHIAKLARTLPMHQEMQGPRCANLAGFVERRRRAIMALLTTEALVLRGYKLGETSKVVVLLTRERGKVRARRPRGTRAAGPATSRPSSRCPRCG